MRREGGGGREAWVSDRRPSRIKYHVCVWLGNFSWLSDARAIEQSKKEKKQNAVRPRFTHEQSRREHGRTISRYGFRIAI